MQGNWIYLALSGLSGVLLALSLHWCILLLFILLMLRIYFLQHLRFLLLASVVFLFFYFISVSLELQRMTVYSEDDSRFIATMTELPQIDGDRLKGVVKTKEQEKLVLHYTIASESEKEHLLAQLFPGNKLLIIGKLQQPEKNRNEHQFNYQQYLYYNHIHWILKAEELILYEEKTSKSFYEHFLTMRAKGLKRIEEKYPPEAIPYVKALIFGDRSSMDEETDQIYRHLGIVHLLAISGLHVGMIISVLYYLLLRAGITRETCYWLLMLFLPFYAIISGGNPPVLRASIMSMLLLSALRWKWPLTPFDAISISFLLFLLVDPYVCFHIGFQLSYAVSAALVCSGKIIARYQAFSTKMLVISLVSTFASIPILAYHFYEFSLVAFIANLLFVPLYTFFMLPLAFITFFMSFTFQAPFNIITNLFEAMIGISKWLSNPFASTHWLTYVTGRPHSMILFLFVAALIFLFRSWEKRGFSYRHILPLLLVLLLQAVINLYSPFGEVIFIDVGQGDAILIKLPYRHGTYLIDTGGEMTFSQESWQEREKRFRVGKDILLPVLKSKGIRTIDTLLITHSHLDHMGAAHELVAQLNVREILLSPQSWRQPVMQELLQAASKKNVPIREVKDGHGWENKAGRFRIVYPYGPGEGANNDSLVLYAEFGAKKWLFTGDLEKEGEEMLLQRYHFHADVLKVGHHGSNTSTTEAFLHMLRPTYAVISAGKNNRYGHPNSEVISLLEAEGVVIYRTDLEGAIHYKYFGNKGTFYTIQP